MTEDASTELRAMLYSYGSNPHVWLLELAPQIPDQLLPWAAHTATLTGDQDLRGLLLFELASRLPPEQQAAALEGVYVPPFDFKARYTHPAGSRASFLMSTLAEEERGRIFEELFKIIADLMREASRYNQYNQSYTPFEGQRTASAGSPPAPSATESEAASEAEPGSEKVASWWSRIRKKWNPPSRENVIDKSYGAPMSPASEEADTIGYGSKSRDEPWEKGGTGKFEPPESGDSLLKGGGKSSSYDSPQSWDPPTGGGGGGSAYDLQSSWGSSGKGKGGGGGDRYYGSPASEASATEADVDDSKSSSKSWEPRPVPPAADNWGVEQMHQQDDSGGGGGGGWVAHEPEQSSAEPTAAALPPATEPPAERKLSANEADDRELQLDSAEPPPRDVVNLGFTPTLFADRLLPPDQSLALNTEYYIWINVGYPMTKSAGGGQSLGVKKLPKEARLQVALFAFDDELQIIPGEDVGELKIQPNGQVKVLRQPARNDREISLSADADPKTLDDILFFPVRTPAEEGAYRVRCNFYCEQMLVQSHLITAQVTSTPLMSEHAVDVVVDYTLSETLNPGHLASLAAQPHLLSMMLNSGDDGSYNIRFFGSNEAEGVGLVKDDAPIDADEIKDYLVQARSMMHKVAWDREEEWDSKNKWPYRYQDESFDAAKLAKDLAYLARAGSRIYWGILDNLTIDSDQLEALMSKTGLVQIALKLSPPAVLPAAIIYDYAWDSDAYDFETTNFSLCETFAAGIEAANKGVAKMEQCLCFLGQCSLKQKIKAIQQDPEKNLRDLPPIICPSGFWGFRHALGFPLTLAKGLNANPVITYDDKVRVLAAVSTDPEFVKRDDHIDRLTALTKGGLDRDESYDQILKRLKLTKPHLIYFYCHGGIRLNKSPYLEVGADDRFSPESFMKEGIRWPSNPRPLVFINGCHTTSLNPEVALNFVTPLVQLGGASGVIGTEITIFEPLAVKFAEECLQRFLGEPPYDPGMPIGQAVRGARLELLRLGNPLGLVYIPFVMAGLRMLSSANPN